MISSWRKRWAARRAAKRGKDMNEEMEMEIVTPNLFRCPISLDLMKDPVTLSTGITYDRESIERWIEAGNVICPITKQALRSLEAVPNHMIRRMIQDWCVENRAYGVERIPTPRIPVSAAEVFEWNANITAWSKRNDRVGCKNLVAKIKNSIKESDRNRKCIVGNGTASILCSVFHDFSKDELNDNVGVFDEIMSCLTLLFPLDEEARSFLGSNSSMDCIVRFLKSGDLSRRRKAIMIVNQIISDQKMLQTLSETDGVIEELFKLIKEPICPPATKASLTITYNMINSFPQIATKFVDMGLVQLLLETIVDADKSVSEKALGVLDAAFGFESGRNMAYTHALTIPVVAKKIHRVSNLGTEFSVSIIWKLCKNETRQEGGVVVDALEMSVFQKLLVLLQVGCGEETREKATELLKLLNDDRDRLECIDSADLKNLKRSF